MLAGLSGWFIRSEPRGHGSVLSHATAHNRGRPENPLSDDELSAKFVELASIHFGESRSRDLLDRLWRFDEIEDIRELIAGLAAT